MKQINKNTFIKKIAKVTVLAISFIAITVATLLAMPKTSLAATCFKDPDYTAAGSDANVPSGECESQASYVFAGDNNPSDPNPTIVYTSRSQSGNSTQLAVLFLQDPTADPLEWTGQVGDPQGGYPLHQMSIRIDRGNINNDISGMSATRLDNGQTTKQIAIPANDILTAFAKANGLNVQNVLTGPGGDPCAGAAGPGVASCAGTATTLITDWVNPALTFLSIGVGVIVAIVVVIGGIQYITSAGNPQAAAAAKKRIADALLAVIAYFLIYALLRWIIPGSKF